MVEIGTEILDSEDTDPEDDVPLANLQPILANTSQIKIEKEDSVLKTPEPSKKLKKKKEEFFTISSVIKPPSEVNKRSRRSPVKSPQVIPIVITGIFIVNRDFRESMIGIALQLCHFRIC